MRTLKTLKVLHKSRYVKALRNIIEMDKPCKECPIVAGLKTDGYFMGDECSDNGPEERLCWDFIGQKLENVWPRCPCEILGKKEALALARQSIALWDKGEHPWQKEKK